MAIGLHAAFSIGNDFAKQLLAYIPLNLREHMYLCTTA